MGGAIGFTLREASGKEHRMCRWTNCTPTWVTSVGMVLKQEAHIQSILKPWYAALLDVKKHGKKATHNTAMYAMEGRGLRPVEYGLIVVDMVNNVILDCNGYSCAGYIYSGSVSNDFIGYDPKPAWTRRRAIPPGGVDVKDLWWFKELNDYGDGIRAMDFVLLQRIRQARYFDAETETHRVRDFAPFINTREFLQDIKTRRAAGKYDSYVIDMSPFTVVTFPETADGFQAFRTKLKELDFKLLVKEEKAWDTFIADRFNEE